VNCCKMLPHLHFFVLHLFCCSLLWHSWISLFQWMKKITHCLRVKIRTYQGLFIGYCLSWSIQSEKLSCKFWYPPHLILFWNIMIISLILFLLSFLQCQSILQKRWV
jgi:hypothetical protein